MVMLNDIEMALRAVQSTQAAIRSLSLEQTEGWRTEIVRQRRALSECFSRLFQLADEWTPPHEVAAAFGEFRRMLPRVRSAIAFHQASWPAVCLDTSSSDYLRSLEQVRARSSELEEAFGRVLSTVAG